MNYLLFVFFLFVQSHPSLWAGRRRSTIGVSTLREILIADLEGERKYTGQNGYMEISNLYYQGRMAAAHRAMRSALNLQQSDRLNWGNRFQGSTEEFLQVADRIFFPDGSARPEFKSLLGRLRYADTFQEGDLKVAYSNVSAVVTEKAFKKLKWGHLYIGTTSDFLRERMQLLGDSKTPLPEYRGLNGYALYADRFYDGNMSDARRNAKAALTPTEHKALRWGKVYRGHTSDYRRERQRIIQASGEVFQEYRGIEGYIKYANDYHFGQMMRAFQNISAVLTKAERQRLNWPNQFSGHSEDLLHVRQFLFADGIELAINRWFGKSRGLGQAVIDYLEANGYTHPIAFKHVSQTRVRLRAAVSREEMERLGWHSVFAEKGDFEKLHISNSYVLRCHSLFP